jgi:hypothetical protein
MDSLRLHIRCLKEPGYTGAVIWDNTEGVPAVIQPIRGPPRVKRTAVQHTNHISCSSVGPLPVAMQLRETRWPGLGSYSVWTARWLYWQSIMQAPVDRGRSTGVLQLETKTQTSAGMQQDCEENVGSAAFLQLNKKNPYVKKRRLNNLSLQNRDCHLARITSGGRLCHHEPWHFFTFFIIHN